MGKKATNPCQAKSEYVSDMSWRGLNKVIVEMLEEQQAGRAIFERLGFRLEGRLSAHARDRHGQRRNLLLLAYHVS